MSTVLSPHDWQQLSEYLDGQLGHRDQYQVENLLAASTEWQSALQSLTNTRSALRTAPKRRAPRNFTLSATQAEQIRKPARNFGFFRLSSAFSTALAVLFLVLGFTLKSAPTALPMAVAPVMEKSVGTSAESTPIPVIIWGSPEMNQYAYTNANPVAGGKGGGGGGGGGDGITNASKSASDAEPMTAAEVPETLALAPEATSSAQDQAVEPEVAPPAMALAPTATAEAPQTFALALEDTQPAADTSISSSQGIAGSGPILGIQSTGPAVELEEKNLVEPENLSRSMENEINEPMPLWWMAAAVMLVLALLTGIMGWKPSWKSKK